MGFKEWFDDRFGGGDSADTSNDYDIDYDQLDQNDSWSPNQDVHKSGEAYKQYQQAQDDYRKAQQNYDNNAGWLTDDVSAANANSELNKYKQASDNAYNAWQNTINPLVPNYKPDYDAPTSTTNPQTNYLSDDIYTSLGIDPDTGKGQMDDNDAWSPFWQNGKTAQQADQERYGDILSSNADDGGILSKAGASKYMANPDASADEIKDNLMKPFNWLADTAKNVWDSFTDGLTPTHVDVDSETKRSYANMLIDYIEQGMGTEEIKEAEAGNAGFIDWLGYIKPFEASGDSKAAMTKTFDEIVAHDMKTGANALGYKSIGDARTGFNANKDKNKDYEKAESTDRMKVEDPEMYAKYSQMNPAQQAVYRALQSAKGGLASLGNAMLNAIAKGGSEVSKATENVMFNLNTTPAQRAAYIIANGGLPNKGILENGQVSEFTQEQWDNMAASDKARLEKLYGIDSLSDFNKALRELNYNIGSSSGFNEYYEGKRKEIVEATKPIRDYANVKAYEAAYGLNGVAKLGIELIPSAIGMAFDAVVGGLPAMGMRVFGDAYSRALDQGVEDQRATLYALASAAVEVGTELIGGESVVNAAVYKNKGIFGSGAEAIIGSIDNTTMQKIALAAIGGLEEGLEEDMAQLCEPVVEAILETDFFQAVKENYGEQRAADYAWAALGGALMSIAGAPVADTMSSISNRAAANRINEETGRPEFVAPNIDGTSRADNPNGKAVYSNSGIKIADINRRKSISGNPLAMASYEQAIKNGASEEDARDTAAYVNDATSTLTSKEKQTYANDQEKFNADIDAFNEHRDEFRNAEVGDVILDIDNNEVGTVTKADENGITVELTNADGEKTTEEVKFVGNNGILDAESDLAKALGKDGEGVIVNAEEAKTFVKEATERRQEAESRKAAAQAQGTTDSGTGTPVTQQQTQQQEEQPAPQKAPAPIKPASNESTDSGTGTVATSQAANPLVQQERKTSGEERAEEQAPPAPKAETTTPTNPLVQEEHSTSGEERAEQQSPEASKSKAQQFFDEHPQKGIVYTSDYKGAIVKIKNNGDGTYTVSMASPLKNGTGFTKAAKTIGTVSSIDEANQLVVDEYNKRNPGQKAFGETLGITSEMAPESPTIASDGTGKSVPTQAQESSQAQNEMLNTASESEAKTKAQKPLAQDDELALLDGGSMENTRNNKPEKTTSVGNTDYVTDSDTKAVNDLNNSKETYKLGDERYTADDVAKMSGGEVLNRLKAWAKSLNLGGLRNFTTNLAQAIAGNRDYQGKNSQVEKSFSEVRGENGNIKNDFKNKTNLDRAAYEESQTKEALDKERADAAYMYLQGQDFDAPLQSVIDNLLEAQEDYKKAATRFIFEKIFRNSGLDIETATVEDAINALAPVTVEQALSSDESQLSEADREEVSALLDKAKEIEVRFGSGEYTPLSDVLNGTAELTTSNDSNFTEGDFHGETVYGEQVAAIQEDLTALREELDQLQQLGNLGEENQQRVSEIQNQIESLEEQVARLQESEETVENSSDRTIRNPLTENDYESVLAEDERRDATAARERRNKPELGSVKKDNASFIAESDVPAAHKQKGATGNFGRVRGIDVDGTTYYALVSEKNGAYRHIMPDKVVARAKNIFNRLSAAIEQKQRVVEYYRSMGVDQNPYAKGTEEYNARERSLLNFNKAFNDLLDLQEKFDKISNGRYTFSNLWNDKSMPSDLRKAIAGEAAFANYNIQSVADAVLESDAIKGINAMKGATNGQSSSETIRFNQFGNRNQSQSGRRNALIPDRANGQLAGQSGRVQNQSNGISEGRLSTLGYDGQARPNESRRDAKRRVTKEAKGRARSIASEANSLLKSEGSVLGAFAAMQRRGYSGRVYNNGKMAVITSGVKTIAHQTDQQSSLLSRILDRVRNRDTEAYMVDSVTVITQSGATELGGITVFQDGKALIYASTEQGLLHESNHDDLERASDYIVNNGLASDPIKWLDNRLAMICRTAGVDYNTLKKLAGSQYSRDVVEEVYCELASLLYDEDSVSFFDGNNGNYFTEAADKLRNNAAFGRLVDTINQYSDTQATLNYVEDAEDKGKRVGEHIAFQRDFGSDDISPMSDESIQSLIDQENAYNNAALGEGTPIDQSDINTLVNEASADETDLLNSRGGNVSAEDTGRFNNLVDQASASERETLNDLRNDSEDITNASEGSFDNLVDTENESVENALNEAAESSANQYPERRFKDAKDYYGSAYDKVVKPVAERHARANSRSSFTHEDIYNKLYGNTPNARQNFRRLQKLNTNIDSLLKGKMSAQAFNGFIKNMMDEQGIAQILNDDIQKEFSELAKLEEKATGGDQRESDVINFQYSAADAVAHLCARMDMVEKTERARAKLDALAKDNGKKGNKNAVANALDWYNRMQITGDNFWRMAGNWDAESRNQGYALAQEHNKSIATRISEEAKLKSYFGNINKSSKEFRDFASGKTMSNVDFGGHKISLMEAVKFVKVCDTMRAFANENRRPDWQRVAALGGFAFEGNDGKPVFVDIEGSKKNGGTERVEWVQERYDAAMAEIQANKAAYEYMKAAEEMYWDASQTAEKVHSKVNGYERYMYGKGKYTDIHYANKNGTVDFSYKDRDATDVHDTGIMQKRTRVNGGYVMVPAMSRSVDAYISQISNYIAFEEFGQKLGVLNDSKSINGNYGNTAADAYGSQYRKWFDNYVKSMTLYRENDPTKLTDKALSKARQAMMTGALSMSVSVPIKQVSSFFDTIGMLDPRAVTRVFATNPLGLKQKGIKNYLYASRGQSISDPDLAELFSDKGMLGRFKNTKVGKVLMSATNMMDEKAVSNVYMACVYDTELNTLSPDRLYNNGKNFKDGLTAEGQFYVDSKFEQVLLGTQPIFTPQARNELARTDNQLLRMFQTFRTQQTQNYNRALQSMNEWKAATKNGGNASAAFKKVRQTIAGQLAASASLAALNAIATTLLHKHHKYKDDDDEWDKTKFLKRYGLDAIESMMGNALWLGDLTKWIIDKADISDSREFYGVASGALGTAWTIVSSATDLYRSIQEDGWTQSNKVAARYLAGNVATAMGQPLNNAYALINAGWQWYADIAGIDRKYDDMFLQWAYVNDTPQNRLVGAIMQGNNDKIADMYEDMGQDAFTNAVYYGALDKYKQGKIDETEYVEMLMNFAGKSYKEASEEVAKKKALIESGISQYNGIDGRDGRNNFYDTYSDRFNSKDAYKQFFSDVKAAKPEGMHNTYYTTYNKQQQEVTANQSAIIDTLNKNIRAGNITYETARLLWEKYYGYSTSKWSAWQFVGK